LQSSMNTTFTRQPDQSVLAEGANGRGTYSMTLTSPMAHISALKLELLADPKLPTGGPGRAHNGNVVLSEIRVTAAPKGDPTKAASVAFAGTVADFSQAGYAVAGAVDGNPQSGWAVSPEFGKNHFGIFEIKDGVKHDGGITLVVTFDHQYDEVHTIGKFRISATASPKALQIQTLPAGLPEILALPRDKRSPAQQTQLADYFRSQDPEWVRLRGAVASAVAQQSNIRLTGAQDLAWALINSPAFLFNR